MNISLTIAEEIKRQRLLIARFSFLTFAASPHITAQMLKGFAGQDPPYFMFYTKKGFDKTQIEYPNPQDIEAHRINLSEALAYTEANPSTNIEFFNTLLIGSIIKIGDLLAESSYFDKTPELEFFRHVRNGIAHNNKFVFNGRTLKKPANFRNFVITQAIEGQNVLRYANEASFLDEGDLLDLLVELEGQLRGHVY